MADVIGIGLHVHNFIDDGSTDDDDLSYLGWRKETISSPKIQSFGDKTKLLDEVQKCLKSSIFREPPPFITAMKPNDKIPNWNIVHSKPMIEWYIRRVKATNNMGGPRCKLVWNGTIQKLGRIPRW